MRVIEGVGPDAQVVANERGAKASKPAARMDLLPHRALLEIGKLGLFGADKYGVDNWRGFDVNDHLNHADVHLHAHLAGDRQEGPIGHLSRLALRALFALETAIDDERKKQETAS